MALPNTFATMAAGNVAAADLDANFTYLLNLINNLSGGGLRDYLAGLNLSNDSTTPNSVLDVSPGVAADSTNSVLISLGSIFYGSTGGAWSAGAGTSGSPIDKMGAGLTIADNTTYHVFAIINGGAADVYFDTSVSAANAPSGTTAFRRVGSFKTAPASTNILGFIQRGDYFEWATLGAGAQDFSTTNPGTSAVLQALNVPLGINVLAQTVFNVTNGGTGGNAHAIITDPATADVAPSQAQSQLTNADGVLGTTTSVSQQISVYTDTSSRVRYRLSYSDGNVTMSARTVGWMDTRGRFA